MDRRDKYQQMHVLLNEKQWRHYLALEAKERGSVAQVAQEANVSHNTIRRGIREVEAGERYTPGQRQREKGGGRKKESAQDSTLLAGLEGLLEPKGEPMSLFKWTCKSVAHLKGALQQMGHTIADTALRDVLLSLGYSLRANKTNIEGSSSADRDARFTHIQKFQQTCSCYGACAVSHESVCYPFFYCGKASAMESQLLTFHCTSEAFHCTGHGLRDHTTGIASSIP